MNRKYMNFSKINKFVIVSFLVGSLCAEVPVALPEGLEKIVTQDMRDNGGGDLLQDANGKISFNYKLKVKNIDTVVVRYFHIDKELGEVVFYRDFSFMLSNVNNVDSKGVHYKDFVPEWSMSKRIGARDIESEALLQRSLTPKMIEESSNFLRLPDSTNVEHLSFSAKISPQTIVVYQMTLTSSSNLKGVVEYFPLLGFFRWTFQEPVPGSEWRYREWPHAKVP